MKHVTHTSTYPGATLEEIHAMLADPAYRKAVADHQRVTDFSCEITPSQGGPSGAGMRVRLEEAHATDRVPPFAQRLVGSEIRLVRAESWTSPHAADLQVTIPGKPGEMTGTITLAPSGPDVAQQIHLDVKVGLPLVGGKLEELVAGFVGKSFDAEHEVGLRWLRGELPA